MRGMSTNTVDQDIEALVREIEAYGRAAQLAGATITKRAVQNSRLYASLKSGRGDCGLRTAARIRAWMAANPPAPSTEAAE